MKNLGLIAVAAIVVIGGYMLFSGKTVEDVTTGAEEAVTAPAALESASEAVEAVQGAATEAVEAVTGEAAEAAGEAATATEQAVEAATEEAGEAATAAQDAVEDTAEAVSDAVTPAEPDASVLSVDGFDLEKVTAMIDGSNLGDLQKSALKSTLKAAQDSPVMLKVALDEAKAALGL